MNNGGNTDVSEEFDFPIPIYLVHANKSLRLNWQWLWKFDQRLSSLARRDGEAMLMQMRLSWWRSQIDVTQQGKGGRDPLLTYLGKCNVAETLSAYGIRLIDAHEAMALGDKLTSAMADRGAALAESYAALSNEISLDMAATIGSAWGLTQTPWHIMTDAEQADRSAKAGALLQEIQDSQIKMPRALSLMAITARFQNQNWPQQMRRRDALLLSLHGLTGI